MKDHFPFREKPLFLLVLITLLYFYRPIFFGDVFYFRDLYAHFVPIKKLVAENLLRHTLPLWNPYLQGGSPLLANPNNMVLYPSNLLYLWIPAHRALTIEIIFHLLMGMIAVYAFARLLLLDQISGLIAAVIFGFSGYGFSTLNFLNWLTASAYLPVIFCFWHLYMTQSKKRWLVLSVLAACLQMFAGAPEISFITFGSLLLWTLWYRYSLTLLRKTFLWIVFALFTAGICSVLILPSMELSRVSIRSFGFGFDTSTAWSIHPYRLAEFIFPGILGRLDSIAPGAFWGEKLEGTNPYFLSIYVGLAAWILAIAGGFSPKESSSFPYAIRKKLFILILFLSLLSTAHYIPGIAQLYSALSLRIPFRYPVKLLAAIIFPFSLLAAFGSSVLFHNGNSKNYRLLFWLLSAFLLVLLALFYFSGSIVEAVSKTMFDRSVTAVMRKTWMLSLIHTFSIWTLICLIRETRLNSKLGALAAILILDLLIAGIPYKIFAPSELYTTEPQLLPLLRREIGHGKLFRAPTQQTMLRTPDTDLFWSIRYHQETLAGHLASNYGIPVIFHDDQDASSLTELNYLRLVIGSLPWEKKLPLFDAADVHLILTPEEIAFPELQPLARILNVSVKPFYLYSNKDAFIPPTFTNQWLTSKNPAETLNRMKSEEFAHGGKIVLQTPLAPTAKSCAAFELIRKNETLRSKSFEVKSDCDGFLVFGEPAYPGWQVQVDGATNPLVRANFIYFATFLERGTHRIEELYSPNSVRWGFLATLVSILLLAVIVIKFIK